MQQNCSLWTISLQNLQILGQFGAENRLNVYPGPQTPPPTQTLGHFT